MLNAIETRTPPTIDYLSWLPAGGRTAAKIAAEVTQIDKALTALDELLNLLQPPHTGKIRIEWWGGMGGACRHRSSGRTRKRAGARYGCLVRDFRDE